MAFSIPEHLIIKTTDHWIVNHRVDSRLPGYVMIGSCLDAADLAGLPRAALAELGELLAHAQQILRDILGAEHVYLGRYGHQAGPSIHFHVIPIYAWVKAAFKADSRYAALQSLRTTGAGNTEYDGAEMTLFVWREFCEGPNAPAVQGPSVSDVVRRLRQNMPGKT